MLESGRQQLGSNLRSLRKKAGKTGRVIAAETGMSQAKVSRLENGRYIPTEAAVSAYAKACHANRTEIGELLRVLKSLQTQWADAEGVRRIQKAKQPQQTQSLEGSATSVDVFEGTCVPAVLQTPTYDKYFARTHPWWLAVNDSEFLAAR